MKNVFTIIILFAACSGLLFPANDTIYVMTYNIQMGTYYNSETTPKAVSQIVLNNNIDFLGTQELHTTGLKDLAAYLPGYSWFGIGRDDGKDLGETSGIFYNSGKYTLLEQSTFWLSETPDIVGTKSWNSSDVRITTWGKFRVNSDSSVLYFFNTHYDHISNWAREESSKLMLEKIYEIAGMNPVIFTGDFNMVSSANEYKILTANYYNYLQLYDSKFISLTGNTGPEGTFNDYLYDNPSQKIDYVFCNPFIEVVSHKVITDKYEGKFISDHFPIKAGICIKRPSPPVTPVLNAVAGNKKVALYWDSKAETDTWETFADSVNDFQGYKLYKSKTPDMEGALLVPGKWNIPLLRNPLFECDIIDDKSGYTNYGIVDGFGYYLGSNNGIRHFYIDDEVQNGETYYYVLLSHDSGIKDMAEGFPPMESPFILETDAAGALINKTSNVASASPTAPVPGSESPAAVFESQGYFGTGDITINIIDPSKIKEGRYKLTFDADTIPLNAVSSEKYRSPHDVYYVNSGITITSLSTDSVIYRETKGKYNANNIVLNRYLNYYYINASEPVVTDEADGFQVTLNNLVEKGVYDPLTSGWSKGNAAIEVIPSSKESGFFPWNCEIVFGEEYKGLTNTSKSVYDETGSIVAYTQLLLNKTFNFSVKSKDFPGENLDLVAVDVDMNGTFEYEKDKVLAGYYVQIANKVYWAGTVFSISFANAAANMPAAGDIYQVRFKRPFIAADEIIFSIKQQPVSVEDKNNENTAREFSLSQNYPNPFNPSTVINYSIDNPGIYKMDVFNILGEKVCNLFEGNREAGKYSVNFNASSLPAGVYIYSLTGEGQRLTKKMLFVK